MTNSSATALDPWLVPPARFHPEDEMHVFYTPSCVYCRAARRDRLIKFWRRIDAARPRIDRAKVIG
jgi:hypothetical protein